MSSPRLRFYGGQAGALASFTLFLMGVAWLGLSGAPDEKGFWPVLLAALALGLLLAKDRTAYSEIVIRGMSQPIVLLMIMAWLLAGVLGTIMAGTGFVEALVWLARQAGVSGGGYVAAAFLICCGVSTSTGTSIGTILLCGPLLYPAGSALGVEPAVLMGAETMSLQSPTRRSRPLSPRTRKSAKW
jgi:Na+/H+ antiporter NhaC